jgi:hypothetical protein
MQKAQQSIQDLIDANFTHEESTIRQYAKSMAAICDFFGKDEITRQEMDADLSVYLAFAPKFTKSNSKLRETIAVRGWSEKTFKQHQSNGRRLIEKFSGAFEARIERRERVDGFHHVKERLGKLTEAKLMDKEDPKRICSLIDTARAADLDVCDINRDTVIGLHTSCETSRHWYNVCRGAKVLDRLRVFPTMRDLLPIEPIGELSGVFRKANDLPQQFEQEIEDWIAAGCVHDIEYLETKEAQEQYRTPHSQGAIGITRAALRKFVATALKLEPDLRVNSILSLITKPMTERVILAWDRGSFKADGISRRSIYQYINRIRLCLLALQHEHEASQIKLLYEMAPLKEGQKAGEYMSPATEKWCDELLNCERKKRTFELQHVSYHRKAVEVLAVAQAQDFDLFKLSDPRKMSELKAPQRGRAKKLLKQARIFGVCAAFAAIELEVAPFRKENTLGLLMSGGKQTFFDHRKTSPASMRILMPNDLLKNGAAMTRRNQSFAPFELFKEEGSFAFEILSFYLDKIRPLFPGAKGSRCLFPSIEPGTKHLCTGTFDRWLLEASIAVGLPLTAHNFRHGLASLEINEDLSSIDYIAFLLGDDPVTVRKYYAFIQREKKTRELQIKRNQRRSRYVGSAVTKQVTA